MFHIIIYIFYTICYLLIWIFKLVVYVSIFIIRLMYSFFIKNQKEINITNTDRFEGYEKLDFNIELENKKIEEYKLVEPNDLEYKMTIGKIEDSYKKLGFNVKVTDIKKNKYNTEYEVIFTQETTQFEILSVSSEVIDNFIIDGVNIKPMKKQSNKIIVCIPLEYKLV